MAVISGTPGDDTLVGGNGNDRIYGYGGNDAIQGGNGRDTLSGGAGNDTLSGGALSDDIYAGSGDDVIYGGARDEVIYAGDGNDLVYADDVGVADVYADVVYGGNGDDTLYGGDGNNTRVAGGAGDDIIYGGVGQLDRLSGGSGNDYLFGGAGNDIFDLGGGNDTVGDYTVGADTLVLGAGNTPSGTAELLARLSSDGNGDAVYDLGAGSSVTLIGYSTGSLKATDLGALTNTYSQSVQYNVPSSGFNGFNDPRVVELANGDFAIAFDADSTASGTDGNDIFFQIIRAREDDTLAGIDGFDTVTGIVHANNIEDTVQGIDEWSDHQRDPNIEATADGGFALQWEDDAGSSDPDVYIKYFDASGTAVDLDGDLDNTNDGFFISDDSGTTPGNTGTATLTNGDIVAVYAEADGLKFRTLAETGSGVTMSSEVTVTTNTLWSGTHPAVAALADGGFVVTWEDLSVGPQYQRFNADGTTIDTSPVTYRVGTASQNVAGVDDGGFAIISGGSTDHRIFLFEADPSSSVELAPGDPGAYPYGSQYGIASMTNGGFVVGFDSHKSGYTGYVTVFRADGSVQEDAFAVADTYTGAQADLHVTGLAEGGFAVSWYDSGGVHFRVFEADTTALTLTASAGVPTYGAWGNDTLTGTGGADYLWGDAGDDQISGLGGADSMFGGTGNDVLSGGTGADTISGGAGDDTIHAGDDDDVVSGEAGTDVIEGGGGADVLVGGSGNDALNGGAGADTLSGGSGIDVLTGGSGSDVFVGLLDALDGDTIADLENGDAIVIVGSDLSALDGTVTTGSIDLGGGKSVTLTGIAYEGLSAVYNAGTGATTISLAGLSITGTTGADLLLGTASNGDTLIGLGGADTLSGSGGNDTLSGGTGTDLLVGGGGHDRLSGGTGADTISGDAGNDTIIAGDDGDVAFGGDGQDSAVGGAGDDVLAGGAGADTLSGGTGADTLSGGAGTDVLVGGDGADRFVGSADDLDGDTISDLVSGDVIVVSGADLSSLDGTVTRGTVDLGGGRSVALGGVSNEGLSAVYDGGSGSTTLSLTGLSITGTSGADSLVGTDSNGDSLHGLDGDDTLSGSGGNDTLSGGAGADLLAGGSGSDLFIVGAGDGDDTIADFASGSDQIDSDTTFVDQAAFVAAATDIGSDVQIALGGGQVLTLLGVQTAGLSYADFI